MLYIIIWLLCVFLVTGNTAGRCEKKNGSGFNFRADFDYPSDTRRCTRGSRGKAAKKQRRRLTHALAPFLFRDPSKTFVGDGGTLFGWPLQNHFKINPVGVRRSYLEPRKVAPGAHSDSTVKMRPGGMSEVVFFVMCYFFFGFEFCFPSPFHIAEPPFDV